MSEALRVYTIAGRDGYPPEWHSEIKDLVREHAGHRCIRCGHPYPPGIAKECPRGEWTPCDDLCTHKGPSRQVLSAGAYIDTPEPVHESAFYVRRGLVIEAHWRILTVHHLDGDKLNCRWWNLLALCQRCHLTIQGKVQPGNPWPWDHSEWFRQYAAGFYATTHGGVEIDRDDTDAIDVWLAFGAEHAATERMRL